MAENTMRCPHCQKEIEITELMKAQLEIRIREELDVHLDQIQEKARQQAQDAVAVELRDGEAQLKEAKKQLKEAQVNELAWRKKQRELEQREAAMEQDKQQLEEKLREELATEKQSLIDQGKQKAREEVQVELKDRETELGELREKVKKASETELALRKRERELTEKAEQTDLEVARRLEQERQRIRTQTLKHADEDHQLKVKEKDLQIEAMRKQIDELKRKAEEGSQQSQGEVLEVELEQLLKRLFPTDAIEPVPTGVKGGDVLQGVLDESGMDCGSILWESKRTKNWTQAWLAKLRDDQRAAKATYAVLVSTALPEDISHFGHKDDIWICDWSCVQGTAAALRSGLAATARSKRAKEGQAGKMQLVYNYLSSQEFYNRVSGVVEAFRTMKEDLESEKRAFHRQWSKREKQLERALLNTGGLYGDLQGIIGSSTLKEIEGMTLPALGEGDAVEPKALTSGS